MKLISNIENTKRKDGIVQKFLGITAVGAFAAAPFLGLMATSEAQPPRHAPAWGNRRKQDDDKDRNRRDRDRRDRDRRDRDRRDRDRRDRDRRDRDRNDRDRRDRDRNNNNRTFTGTVTGITRDRFDIRVGGTTYNVVPNGGVPRGISRGDSVRVYGVRSGNNDIRNANVTVLRRR